MSEAIVVTDEQEGEFLPAVRTATLSVTPQVPAAELVARLGVIEDAMRTAMVQDVDFGVIPGTDKPALLKPGAEKLGALFQLDVQLDNEKIWHDDGHLTVISRAVVWHQPTGMRLGAGEGLCTTREGRYAYRNANRKCPTCGVEAIIKGKAEYGGGWVCFKKKNGCGAKFADDAQEIVSQSAGKVPNPDLADTYNTVTKMASKRARVDAVLSVTGASALFTQDIEDAVVAESAAESVERVADPHGLQSARADAPAPSDAATDKQKAMIERKAKSLGLTVSIDGLSKRDASAKIEELIALEKNASAVEAGPGNSDLDDIPFARSFG